MKYTVLLVVAFWSFKSQENIPEPKDFVYDAATNQFGKLSFEKTTLDKVIEIYGDEFISSDKMVTFEYTPLEYWGCNFDVRYDRDTITKIDTIWYKDIFYEKYGITFCFSKSKLHLFEYRLLSIELKPPYQELIYGVKVGKHRFKEVFSLLENESIDSYSEENEHQINIYKNMVAFHSEFILNEENSNSKEFNFSDWKKLSKNYIVEKITIHSFDIWQFK